jgi:hypothetical protein
MHDHFSEYYEWDADGIPRRKKRVARDREQISFPMTAMDQAAFAFNPTFSDGSPDFTSPFKPGYRFLDVNDAARLAADAAYEARSERMQNAWRTKGDVKADTRDAAPPRTRTLDELRAASAAAYEARSKRMAGAWKNRHD